MVIYKKISDIKPVAEYMAERIINSLHAGHQVLWLVSGGSAIEVAVATAELLHGKDLRLLTVSLTDERYGAVGHTDSNWQKMLDAGFELPGASLVPVLEKGEDRALATEQFSDSLRGLLRRAEYTLGFFGVGTDAHTAGILPDSPAFDAKGYAATYDGGGYKRITMTPTAIRQLDEAVLYAVGEQKWPVIDALAKDMPVNAQPVQLLKEVPLLTVCSDHKGDKV
jgi:6-phosphogluconolactonase/glucosamine-6-phosphate isomerase/deaminase